MGDLGGAAAEAGCAGKSPPGAPASATPEGERRKPKQVVLTVERSKCKTSFRVRAQFSQNKNQELYPESLTATMQKQIFDIDAIHQINDRLPLMYKIREKKPVNTFPFSVHDNRHFLNNVGDYLDSGLGLRKFKREMCQHYSQNFLFLAHEPVPSSTNIRSIYQTSFVQYPNVESSLLARFPKNHIKRSIALNPADKKECMWFSKFYASHHNVVPVEPDRSSLPEPKQLLPAVQAAE